MFMLSDQEEGEKMDKYIASDGSIWYIRRDPPPVFIRGADFSFYHEDFDGAPDAFDNRCGYAATEKEAMQEIEDAIIDGF